MGFRDEFRQRIPDELKEDKDFQLLLDMISLNNIRNKGDLYNYFETEIKNIEEWLKQNQAAGGSIILKLRDNVIRLERFRKWKQMCEEFL